MDRLKHITPLPEDRINALGLKWFLGDGEWDYLTSDFIAIKQSESDAFIDAAAQLYKMFEQATQKVIEIGLWKELHIPQNLVRIIEHSWANRAQHMHLYGRFDFAGGLNGLPLKLIEFNADTATTLPETALIQHEQLLLNGYKEYQQCNNLFEDLVEQFGNLKTANPDREPNLLISTMGFPEDDLNAKIISDAAEDAGFTVTHRNLDQVTFSPDEGIFVELDSDNYLKFDFWFKLVPWEFIGDEEPGLADILTSIVLNGHAIIVNPAYTLLYQSKSMMKFLWRLFPNHHLLLKTSTEQRDFSNEPYVKKVVYGREGENISIHDAAGNSLEQRDGDYGEYASIYQAYSKLFKDQVGNYYQPGVYFVHEPSALSFRRRDALIIDEDAMFVGHVIVDDNLF